MNHGVRRQLDGEERILQQEYANAGVSLAGPCALGAAIVVRKFNLKALKVAR